MGVTGRRDIRVITADATFYGRYLVLLSVEAVGLCTTSDRYLATTLSGRTLPSFGL
jgi:hypothetical protein